MRFGVRLSPGMARVAALMSGGMFLFGLVVMSGLAGTGGPAPPVPFALLWLGITGGVAVYYWRMAEGKLYLYEAEGPLPGTGFEERLRRLEALRRDGLLSDEEYQRKRREILDERW